MAMQKITLIISLILAIGCKKPEPVKPSTYDIRIEASGTSYGIKIAGVSKIYTDKQSQQGANSFSVAVPEDVTFYYNTVGPLWVKIYINNVKTIDQTQPVGSHLFYLKRP